MAEQTIVLTKDVHWSVLNILLAQAVHSLINFREESLAGWTFTFDTLTRGTWLPNRQDMKLRGFIYSHV